MRGRSAAPRRILVVGPLPPPNHGVSVMTRALLDSIPGDRYEIVHLDTADRRGVANIGRLDPGNVWLAGVHGARFLSLLARQPVDMVYAPIAPNVLGFMRDALFAGPALLRRLPVIVHLHGGGYRPLLRDAPMPVRQLVRSVMSRASSAIVLGDALTGMLDGVVERDRIDIVPNGVADVAPPGATRERARDGRTRVLFLGNLIPGKGYVELLEAVQLLLDEGVDIDVTFAGGIAEASTHARALASLRYGDDRVRFTGPVGTAEKTRLLTQSDVLALPTYYEHEAHPLVILEAMSAGIPVVSTHHAAIPETVMDGVTGLLVARRDVCALAGGLRSLAERPDARAAMGRAGRERYLDRYTLEHWSDRMISVFDRIGSAAQQ
ncbi:MAG TPA: glycosyltransferase family 4 protein [Longimicrobiales bacterium]|nr:glycosyltransferase family 4 protein [Longimicrobiales bacterium]